MVHAFISQVRRLFSKSARSLYGAILEHWKKIHTRQDISEIN